jgi:hypothetical protein
MCGERGELEEGAAGIDQPIDAVARGQFSALTMPGDGGVPAPGVHLGEMSAQLLDDRAHRGGVAREIVGPRVEARGKEAHRARFAAAALGNLGVRI